GDPGRTVRIVFQPLDSADGVETHAAEIDHAVRALVPATTVVCSGTTSIVAAALLVQTFGQRLDRLARPQLRPIGRDELATARRGRIVSLQTHFCLSPQMPVEMSMV